MKKFIIAVISVMAFLPSQGMTQFAGAGTDYTKAASETWTEDAMNDFLAMANSFACMSKNSRVDLLPNASYESLISEVQCGLNELNAQGTNRDTLSRSVITSSRASNTSTQEGTNWFDSSGGPKFIANMQFKKDPTTFGPYGEWYISYLMAKGGNTNYTTANSPAFGFVDVRPGTGSSIVITSADRSRQGGSEDLIQRSKISYSDTTLNAATLLGEYKGKDESNNAVDIVVAGRTSETNYFRITMTTSGGSTTKVSQCLKRDQTWSNVYKYDVYNKSSGAKLALAGSFGFETAADTRGFYDHNGAWFDSSFVFNKSSNKTVAVTDNDSGTAYTLKWAPGELSARSVVTEALDSGINIYERNGMYVRLIGSTKTATYHSSLAGASASPASGQYTDPWGGSIGATVTKTDIDGSGNDHLGWMHDMTKRSMVYWAGGATVDVQIRTPKSFDATLLAANFTALTQDGDRGVKNMPADLDLWASGDNQASRDYIAGSSGGTANGAAFFFTGLNPTGVANGLLPRTLYIDTATGSGSVTGPDSLDKAVMYNFAVNQRTGNFEDFSDNSAAAFSSKAADDEWPSYDIDLKDSGGTKYRWEFGAYPWDNSIAAIKADGTVKPVDQPVMLKYTHTTAGDVNQAQDTNGLTYFANNSNYFPDKSGLCTVLASNHYSCVAKPSSFDGKTFMLEYNGSHLHGLPEQFATYSDGGSKGSYLKIVNPVDGSVLVGPDGTEYVLKAREVGKSFVPAPSSVYNPASPAYYAADVSSALDCDDLSFDELSDLGSGWAASDLPDVNDTTTYPHTTKTWADLPAASTLKCTVTMGKATGC